MLDEDVLFFGSLNCLNFATQEHRNTQEQRLVLSFGECDQMFEIIREGKDKARLALLRKFISKLGLLNNKPNKYGLMYDIEFFGFLRKPERIHVDKLKSSYRVAMHLAEKTFIGEDENITRAVHKAAKHLYPTFIDCKQIDIPRFKLMGEKSVEDPDKMIIAHAETKSMLKKFRPYIENADLLIVDLEGDQLGPNGIITFIQINCFHDAKCFLIDIKLIGDDELKRHDGWLRKCFESKRQAIVMWGGLQDAANLWYSYEIKVECMLDLQVVELHNRERLKDYSFIPYYEKFLPGSKVPISLETVYKG
jgi:hypothetical protein